MIFYRLLFASCAVVLVETGCDDSSKKQNPGALSGNEPAASASPAGSQVESAAAAPRPAEPAADAGNATPKAPEATTTPEAKDTAAVFPDGSRVTKFDVMKRIELLPERVRSMPFTQLYNMILFVMVQERVAYMSAAKEGFEKDSSVSGHVEQIKANVQRQMFIDAAIKDRITPDAIQKQYDQLLKTFKVEKEYGLRHILVKEREEADRIIEELKNGKSFDELQRQHTIEQINRTDANAGFIGYFRSSMLPPDLREHIEKTSVGSFVPVPMFTPENGYSVLFLADKKDSAPAPLNKVEARVKSLLSRRLALYKMAEIQQTHKVVRYAPNGSVLPEKSVDEKLEDIKAKQNPGWKPSADDVKNESEMNNLKDTFVVAKVGDRSIVFAELTAFIKENATLFRGMPPYDVYLYALDEFLNRIVVDIDAGKAGASQWPDVVSKQKEAVSAYLAREHLIRLSEKDITEAQIRASYDKAAERIDKNEMEISLRVIPASSEDKGKQIIAQLKSAQFDKVLAENCTDKQLLEKKGSLGYLTKEDLSRLGLYESVKKAPKATVLPLPMRVNGQWLVVRVEDKRQQQLPPYAEAKEYLKKQLIQENTVNVTTRLAKEFGVVAYGIDGQELDFEHLRDSLGEAAAGK
ncbi:MAG: peptidyl-prolyl cis-trans isomerase [Holosporales bacterium]|jgi:peptidyl-prolyl cis-trans isomerase C|nr:peptidyl-prolyl cis-trans isomerase [Holosporales bacterium]